MENERLIITASYESNNKINFFIGDDEVAELNLSDRTFSTGLKTVRFHKGNIQQQLRKVLKYFNSPAKHGLFKPEYNYVARLSNMTADITFIYDDRSYVAKYDPLTEIITYKDYVFNVANLSTLHKDEIGKVISDQIVDIAKHWNIEYTWNNSPNINKSDFDELIDNISDEDKADLHKTCKINLYLEQKTINIPNEILIKSDIDNYIVCADCGNIDYADESLHNDRNEPICQQCFETFYRLCDNCDAVIHEDDVYFGNDGVYCCYDCAAECDDVDESDNDYDDNHWTSRYKNIKESDTSFNHIPNRTYGIEIETSNFEGSGLDSEVGDYYSGTYDGSISGEELVSCILLGDKGLEVTRNAMKAAVEEHAAETNSACGYHIHIGVGDYTVADLKRLYDFVTINEDLFYSTVHKNRRENNYCKRLRELPMASEKYKMVATTLNEAVISLVDYNTQNETQERIRNRVRYHRSTKYSTSNRYTWVNFVPIIRQNTVEIRLHGQTLNGNKITKWAQLWVGIIDAIKKKKLNGNKPMTMNAIIDKLALPSNVKTKMKRYFALRIYTFNNSETGMYRTDGSINYVGREMIARYL